MSLLDRLEKKIGRGRGVNLMIILIAAQALGFIMNYIYPTALQFIVFDPYLILQGQVWRLVSFIFFPNGTSIFMTLITCFIYFSISRAVEMTIGRFRLNFFLISGLVMLVLFGFLFWLIFPYPIKNIVVYLNPYYHYAMLFVLFAMLFPDARFFLMFIIPVRGKWMIFITLGLYLLDIVRQFLSGSADYGWFLIFMIFAAILNVVFFMLLSGYRIGKNNARQQQRYGSYGGRQDGRNGASRIRPESQRTTRGPRHKCAVCGRTNETNPELEFRYCTRCIGNYEYCMEHLYTHTHVGGGNG